MNSTNWWYNLTWQQRCEYREQMNADIMTAEMIDLAYNSYLKINCVGN